MREGTKKAYSPGGTFLKVATFFNEPSVNKTNFTFGLNKNLSMNKIIIVRREEKNCRFYHISFTCPKRINVAMFNKDVENPW